MAPCFLICVCILYYLLLKATQIPLKNSLWCSRSIFDDLLTGGISLSRLWFLYKAPIKKKYMFSRKSFLKSRLLKPDTFYSNIEIWEEIIYPIFTWKKLIIQKLLKNYKTDQMEFYLSSLKTAYIYKIFNLTIKDNKIRIKWKDTVIPVLKTCTKSRKESNFNKSTWFYDTNLAVSS